MDNIFSSRSTSNLQEQLTLLGEYLSEQYEFRHNLLSNVYEVRERTTETKPFRPLTKEARNTILRRIKCAGLEVPTLVISYALGFLKQYNRMTKEQKRQFRLLCFRKIARTNFFYQLNGTRHTTPEEQTFIRKCAQSVGYNFPPDGFDHTFTTPAW